MSTKCRPQAWRQSLASSHIPLSLVVPAKDSAPVAIDEDMVAVVMCVTLDGVVGVDGRVVGFGVSKRIGVAESLG